MWVHVLSSVVCPLLQLRFSRSKRDRYFWQQCLGLTQCNRISLFFSSYTHLHLCRALRSLYDCLCRYAFGLWQKKGINVKVWIITRAIISRLKNGFPKCWSVAKSTSCLCQRCNQICENSNDRNVDLCTPHIPKFPNKQSCWSRKNIVLLRAWENSFIICIYSYANVSTYYHYFMLFFPQLLWRNQFLIRQTMVAFKNLYMVFLMVWCLYY